MGLYDRVFNFSAGPATLPVPVLEQCRDELLNHKASGMSVMEMSHRSLEFETIIAETEADLRTLMGIPAEYKVLFLQGGASTQFSTVPMSFLSTGKPPEYVITGAWGKKALEAASVVGEVKVAYDAKGENYRSIPDLGEIPIDPGAAYVHITSNETIHGVEFGGDPVVRAPLVCDMSSDILSRPVDVSRYALIYAGAQKNIGPAGLTVVIVSPAFLDRAPAKTHPMFDYRVQAANNSLYNTPATWAVYVTGLVLKYLIAQGGLHAADQLRRRRSQVLYNVIDESNDYYMGHAHADARSHMNVVFTLNENGMTPEFLKEAENRRLSGLAGHRSVGGCRASLYNAFPIEGCTTLANFMREFAEVHA